MRRGSQDPDQAGRVLDHSENVQARSRQGAGLDEVAREDGLGLAAQERGPCGVRAIRCGIDAVLLENVPYAEAATLMPRTASSPCTRLWPQAGFSLNGGGLGTTPGRLFSPQVSCVVLIGRPGRPPRRSQRDGARAPMVAWPLRLAATVRAGAVTGSGNRMGAWPRWRRTS